MQGPTFKFYIKNSSGQYYYVDDIDTVQVSTLPVQLVHTPKGWMDMLAGLLRNEKYKGNFTKVSTPLQFVLDGKRILDYVFTYEGASAIAKFEILKQVPDDFSYADFFDGTIDFEEYTYGEIFSTANIKENGLIDILDAKEDVVYEIILTPENSVDVEEDGINLYYKTLDTISNGFVTDTGKHIVELIEASNENPFAAPTKRTHFNNLNAADVSGTNYPFYTANVAANVVIQYDFLVLVAMVNSGSVVPLPSSAFTFQIYKIRPDGSVVNHILYNITGRDNMFSGSWYNGKTHHVAGTLTITVDPGDRLYFVGVPRNVNSGNPDNGSLARFTYQGTTMEFIITAVQRQAATRHKGILPHVLWNELIKKATNGEYVGTSSYLAGRSHVLLSGKTLRRDKDLVLQTTIKQFLKYCYVNHLGVVTDVSNGIGAIKYIGDTYLQTESDSLGIVSDLQMRKSKEHTISTIKVGYDNIDFGVDGQINGKDEFNQTNHFTTGQDRIKAEYDIVSPYIASMYAHELLRVNFSKRKSTDNKGDNKVYILDAYPTNITVQLYSGTYDVITFNEVAIPVTLPFFGIANGTIVTITGPNAGTYIVSSTALVGNIYYIAFTTGLPSISGTYNSTFTYSTVLYKPRRPAFATITGLQDTVTAYNIEVSPKHLLLLHAIIIAGGIYNAAASPEMNTIKFQSGDKNVLLSVSYDNIAFITENTDELLSNWPQPLYLPLAFDFDTDYRRDLFTYLQGVRRYQYISFEWKDEIYSGFVIDVESNPDNNKAQKWKLLATVNSNIVNLR